MSNTPWTGEDRPVNEKITFETEHLSTGRASMDGLVFIGVERLLTTEIFLSRIDLMLQFFELFNRKEKMIGTCQVRRGDQGQMTDTAFRWQFTIFAFACWTEITTDRESCRSTALLQMAHAHRGFLVFRTAIR